MSYSASRYSVMALTRAEAKVSPRASAMARKSRQRWGAWLTASMKSMNQAERFLSPTALPKSSQFCGLTRRFFCTDSPPATGRDGIPREQRVATIVTPPSLTHGPTTGVTLAAFGGTLGVVGNTSRRPILAGSTAAGDNRVSRTGGCTMSVPVATSHRAHDDLIDPRCHRHDSPATFVIEYDDTDGKGRRDEVCDRCLPDVLRYAHLTGSFRPPVPVPLNLDLYRAWTAEAVSA